MGGSDEVGAPGEVGDCETGADRGVEPLAAGVSSQDEPIAKTAAASSTATIVDRDIVSAPRLLKLWTSPDDRRAARPAALDTKFASDTESVTLERAGREDRRENCLDSVKSLRRVCLPGSAATGGDHRMG